MHDPSGMDEHEGFEELVGEQRYLRVLELI